MGGKSVDMDDVTLREDLKAPEAELANAHTPDLNDVLAALATGEEGLDPHEAAARLEKFGPNAPPAAPKRSLVMRFLSHFHHILIYVLLGAALVTFLLGHPIDTGVILAVVLANAVIGFLQEGRAEKAMAAIQDMLAPTPMSFVQANAWMWKAQISFPATSSSWKRETRFPPISG